MRYLNLRLSVIPALACCLLAGGAIAAEMTDAEKDALRSSCRSDYFSYCSSVPRGPAVLTCLQKNIASVSPGCRQALSDLGGASAPTSATKAAPAPSAAPAPAPAVVTKTAPPPAASSPPATHATTPSAAPAPPPPATKAAPAAPVAPAAKSAAKPPASTPSAPAKTAAPPPPPAAAVEPAPGPAPAYGPLERLVLLRRACGADARAFCAGVPLGGGRIRECLMAQAPSLSPPCRDALVVLGR